MLTKKGMDAEQADALSKLFKARAKVASKWASSPMEWFNNLGLQFNNANNIDNNKIEDTKFEQSMYRSPQKNFSDFYNQVQSNKTPKQKAYYTYTTNRGVEFDIIHDVVRHNEKKHSLDVNDWNELFNARKQRTV